MTDSGRDHDIVVYGATGFVGILTAGTGRAHSALFQDCTRRPLSVEARADSHDLGVDWPLVVADSQDREAVEAMAASTRVVATTVGPYFKYGKPLVEACAAAGTHYADLTGESVPSLDIDPPTAPRAQVEPGSSTRAVSTRSHPTSARCSCTRRLEKGGHGDLEETTLVVKAMKGAPSGGTIDTAQDRRSTR